MTPKDKPTDEEKKIQTLDEICDNTRAIRRVTNRILDHLHEYQTGASSYHDPDELTWDDMIDNDDMFY